ncbi:MAG: hypothetical protein AMXMBFR23_03590 [Chloroflexota bacterium]
MGRAALRYTPRVLGDLLAGWRFALRRLASGWRFMLVAGLGMVVAATLLAMTPIYASAMSDLGLRFRLDRELSTPERRLAEIVLTGHLAGDPADRARRESVDAVTAARVGWLGDRLLTETRSQRFDLSFPAFEAEAPDEPVEVPAGAETLRQPWGGFVYWLRDFEAHVEVVEGRLPGDGATPEVVLPDGFQRHAALGDTIRIAGARFTDCPSIPPSEDAEEALDEVRCAPTARIATLLDVTVVGFVRPRDAADPRWAIFEGEWAAPDAPLLPRLEGAASLSPQRGLVPRGIGQMPLLTTRAQLEGPFARLLPESGLRHRSGVLLDPARLSVGDVERALADLNGWVTDVNVTLGLSNATSRLAVADVLARYRNAQTFTAVPLLIVLLQVVGIVGYYVVMVMALLLERQSEEIGVYRSRGATGSQLLGLSLVEGLVFAVPAGLAAPWLASGIVAVLGRTPGFAEVTGGDLLPARATPEAYLLGAAGATLALLAILVPAAFAVRRGIIDVKREESRPATQSVFQRYYLDLAVVAFAGILLWQLEQRGSVFDPDSVGGWSSDPMLMLAPLAITAAVASMMLRLYPPLVRLGARLLMLTRGTAAAIGLRRTGRAPAAYARVTLLLIMAISVGAFAASYGPTVERSLSDRANFASGVDLRATLYDGARPDLADRLEEVLAWEGVRGGTLVHRGGMVTSQSTAVQLLGVDPAFLGEHLWWRADFATQPLDALLGVLRSNVTAGAGPAVPDTAVAVEVQVRTPDAARNYVRARFRDATGEVFDAPFEGVILPGAWSTLRVALPVEAQRPLTFAGFLVGDRLGQNLRSEGAMEIDALAAVDRTGARTMLEDFETGFRWTLLNPLSVTETFEVAASGAASGQRAARWAWASSTVPRVRLLAPLDPAVPLAALMDAGALSAFGATPGGVTLSALGEIAMPVQVRGTFDLFPTTAPQGGLVVVNIADLRSAATLANVPDLRYPTEVWLDLDDSLGLAGQQAIAARLVASDSPVRIRTNPELRAAAVEEATSDPTLQASGSGILSVAFVAVLGLSTVGFVVTLVLGARQRAVEFAVLRALGASRPQVLRALVLEWAVVLLLGAGLGAAAGRQVAGVMLGFLGVNEQGAPVLPPFLIVTDWRALGAGIGLLAGVAAASLLGAWLGAMRRPANIELRLTR